jgi:hypothetical protein
MERGLLTEGIYNLLPSSFSSTIVAGNSNGKRSLTPVLDAAAIAVRFHRATLCRRRALSLSFRRTQDFDALLRTLSSK